MIKLSETGTACPNESRRKAAAELPHSRTLGGSSGRDMRKTPLLPTEEWALQPAIGNNGEEESHAEGEKPRERLTERMMVLRKEIGGELKRQEMERVEAVGNLA